MKDESELFEFLQSKEIRYLEMDWVRYQKLFAKKRGEYDPVIQFESFEDENEYSENTFTFGDYAIYVEFTRENYLDYYCGTFDRHNTKLVFPYEQIKKIFYTWNGLRYDIIILGYDSGQKMRGLGGKNLDMDMIKRIKEKMKVYNFTFELMEYITDEIFLKKTTRFKKFVYYCKMLPWIAWPIKNKVFKK
jgi:hypothetical protein